MLQTPPSVFQSHSEPYFSVPELHKLVLQGKKCVKWCKYFLTDSAPAPLQRREVENRPTHLFTAATGGQEQDTSGGTHKQHRSASVTYNQRATKTYLRPSAVGESRIAQNTPPAPTTKHSDRYVPKQLCETHRAQPARNEHRWGIPGVDRSRGREVTSAPLLWVPSRGVITFS